MKNGSVYRDLNATIESYKVEVEWWKPTVISKVNKDLYKICLNKKQ